MIVPEKLATVPFIGDIWIISEIMCLWFIGNHATIMWVPLSSVQKPNMAIKNPMGFPYIWGYANSWRVEFIENPSIHGLFHGESDFSENRGRDSDDYGVSPEWMVSHRKSHEWMIYRLPLHR